MWIYKQKTEKDSIFIEVKPEVVMQDHRIKTIVGEFNLLHDSVKIYWKTRKWTRDYNRLQKSKIGF